MIVSASRRTDIPRWYTPWLMQRLRTETVLIQNPINPKQISRVSLSPDVVDCIVFWSKDPLPLLPYLAEVTRMGHSFYFQFTITPYEKDMEINLRSKNEIAATLIELSERWGKERIVWRYDPILFTSTYTESWHKRQFEAYCRKFRGAVDTVTISFVDIYSKIARLNLLPVSSEQMNRMAAFCGEVAKAYGMRITACAEAGDYTAYGVNRAACIDRERIETILGCPLKLSRDLNQRPGCGCFQSVDIGIYNFCANGCQYCYANMSAAHAKERMLLHDPAGEMLLGTAPGSIKDKKTESCKIQQLEWKF